MCTGGQTWQIRRIYLFALRLVWLVRMKQCHILPVSKGMDDIVSRLLILGLLLTNDMENGEFLCESCAMMA